MRIRSFSQRPPRSSCLAVRQSPVRATSQPGGLSRLVYVSQTRPSSPSDPCGDASSTRPGNQSGDSTSGPSQPPRTAPSHQSRPGPDDDVMLATGRPRSTSSVPSAQHPPQRRPGHAGPSQSPGQTSTAWKRPAPARPAQGGRRPGRKAWVPNQHGAWSMLVLPPVVGWVVGGFSWVNLLLIPAWWGAYLTYWAWSQWLRTRSAQRRVLLLVPLLVYTGWTGVLGLVTVLVTPYLLQWAVPLAPLLAVAAHQVWRGRERSLLSGLSTTAAASLMAAITYCLAVGGAGGFLGLGAGADNLPGSSPNGELTGWSWMWLVTALTAAYFCGTVPYIKSMIRERFNTVLLAGTVAAHTAVAAVTLWLASGGYLPWAHAVLWVVLAVRSLVVPLRQWRLVRGHHQPLRPRQLGLIEIVMCLAFLLSVATY
ncbi:hypothetical protein D4740_02855 [Actinomyces sp. 2119]|nr:hypothetical protein D4740_02855 [Actinomyces sp. 2119]